MRLPEWIRTKNPRRLHDTKRILRRYGLATVCEEARCPNVSECFLKPTAAFMIMGSRCTRNCGFCSVKSSLPEPLDHDETVRVGIAARELGLSYVVITSVTRDDLPDGGAGHFARTVSAVRRYAPGAKVEVLTPDFNGAESSIDTVLRARPDVFNHNVETVPRLYSSVRPLADYQRSLSLLAYIKKTAPGIQIKSGLMLGLGEKLHEVIGVLRDLRDTGCDIVTIGQYLRPMKANIPVVEYIEPAIFERLRLTALSMGFTYAASAPLVRSSMNAEEMYNNEDTKI
ncbi:MAG: lipoyl synthase [Nitrospirae bacterium]|nr:lipoyl synthase [Nitrospirota bacterium]